MRSRSRSPRRIDSTNTEPAENTRRVNISTRRINGERIVYRKQTGKNDEGKETTDGKRVAENPSDESENVGPVSEKKEQKDKRLSPESSGGEPSDSCFSREKIVKRNMSSLEEHLISERTKSTATTSSCYGAEES